MAKKDLLAKNSKVAVEATQFKVILMLPFVLAKREKHFSAVRYFSISTSVPAASSMFLHSFPGMGKLPSKSNLVTITVTLTL